MENIQFLIKFGERQYMQRLAEGYLYFSYAKKFREIEEKLQQKGQGDYLEGSAKIHGTNMQIYDRDTGEYWGQVAKATTICHFAPANQIPVFCLLVTKTIVFVKVITNLALTYLKILYAT